MTLDLNEAAAFLKMHPATLREKAHSGIIPGAKPGKQWVFLQSQLEAYLTAISPCQSIKSEIPGTSTYGRHGVGLDALLALPTRKRRRSTTTGSRGTHGDQTG